MNEPSLIEAFMKIAELGNALGAAPLNKHPACWECKVDKRWKIAVNAHKEPKVSSMSKVPIEPFHAYVEFNGWPAGLLNPYGGTIAAGECANEDTFIAAIEARIARQTP